MASPRQRLHTRHPGNLTVQVERDGVRRFGLISEVSLGGAFLEVEPPPPKDTTVTIIVTRTDGTTIVLPATARYVRTESVGSLDYPGVGLAWGELDGEARAYIADLVKRASSARPLRGE